MPQTPSPVRKKRLPLHWEIALVLVAKTLLLYAIWSLWFDQPMPKEQRLEKTTRIILNK